MTFLPFSRPMPTSFTAASHLALIPTHEILEIQVAEIKLVQNLEKKTSMELMSISRLMEMHDDREAIPKPKKEKEENGKEMESGKENEKKNKKRDWKSKGDWKEICKRL